MPRRFAIRCWPSAGVSIRPAADAEFFRLCRATCWRRSRGPASAGEQAVVEEQSRRSVYIYLKRTLMVPFFETFDYTNTAESVGTRPVTTVAPQALLLLNSEFTDLQARNLAERVRREAGDAQSRQIERLFRLALGRVPTPHEAKIANDLLKRGSDTANDKADPLRSLCLVVLELE